MRIVITGGAGFIGSNAAAYYLKKGADVVVFDNLIRLNSHKNISWLRTLAGSLTYINGDIRSATAMGHLLAYFKRADAVLHLAAQVAVTASIKNPYEDFEINALGTLNVLEAMRSVASKAKLIYASTNKVYGAMDDLEIRETGNRYEYVSLPRGINETRQLDFHSPYGCSKGAADQYVRDYGRIYGLDTVVMRQSCIYGPRQFGVEDQGWVAWFMIAAVTGKTLHIYGNGKQVRDLLYIDDLIRAYDMAIEAGDTTRGSIYNIGGGCLNSLSVWKEFGPMLSAITGKKPGIVHESWRPGDQKIFIADTRLAKRDFGWEPRVSLARGLIHVYDWVCSNAAVVLPNIIHP